MYGLPKKTLRIVQSKVACLILYGLGKVGTCVVLMYVHWLPVALRVDYKVLLSIFHIYSC